MGNEIQGKKDHSPNECYLPLLQDLCPHWWHPWHPWHSAGLPHSQVYTAAWSHISTTTDTKDDADFKTGAKQQQVHFWGLTSFPYRSHQSHHAAGLKSTRGSPHTWQHTTCSYCIQTATQIKGNPQQQAEPTKGCFLPYARPPAWQGWSFPLLNSLPVSRCGSKPCYPEENWGKPEKPPWFCL